MLIKAIKTKLIKPSENIFSIFSKKVRRLKEGSIIVIASKIIAMQQNRIVDATDFPETLKKEAQYISRKECCPGIRLTTKNGILIPNAGIDFSNIEKGKAILWPKDPQNEAEAFYKLAKKNYKIKKLGIIIADSHCQPLRTGTVGITLGCAGFDPVKDVRNHKDLFQNKLKVTQIAVADSLATAANLVMGEADEKTPFVIIENAKVTFTNKKIRHAIMSIKPQKCLFRELYPAGFL